MPTAKLMIVPVTLDPIPDALPSVVPSSQNGSASCIINAADLEISFFNGVDESIIQVILKELSNR